MFDFLLATPKEFVLMKAKLICPTCGHPVFREVESHGHTLTAECVKCARVYAIEFNQLIPTADPGIALSHWVPEETISKILRLARLIERPVVEFTGDLTEMSEHAAKDSRKLAGIIIEETLAILTSKEEGE